MKRFITAAMTVAMTIMCVSAQPPQGGQGGPGGPREPMTPAKRVEMMDKQLTLTADQKTKLTEIFTKQDAEMKKARESMEEGERPDPEQMKATFKKNEEAVKAVLTDEQKTKYEEMRKNRPQPGGGPGGPGGPGPRPEDE